VVNVLGTDLPELKKNRKLQLEEERRAERERKLLPGKPRWQKAIRVTGVFFFKEKNRK